MYGTLTITGEIAALARVAEFAASLDLTTSSESAMVDGWTVENLGVLLRRLAPKQHTLIEHLAREGGALSGDDLRDLFGDDLRGLTGPISKHINAMKAGGILPDDAVAVAVAESDPHDRATRRTSWIRMPSALLPLAARALGLGN